MASNLVNTNKRNFVTYGEPTTGSVQDSLDSKIVGLEDPTYFGFDIFFKFDNTDYLLQPGPIPLTTTGSVVPSLLYPQSDPEATVNYFKRINKDYSAAMLEEFKTHLKDITINYPWYFQTISGLGEILKRPAEGETIYLKDKVLTIECLESIDHRMYYLANLYRHFAYDNTWMRNMLPDNKKKFDCVVYVYEIRDLSYIYGIVDKLHKDINTSSNVNTDTGENTNPSYQKETDGSVSKESQSKTQNNYDYVSKLLNQYITFFKFSFQDCTFNFDDFSSFDTISNNTMTPEQVKFKFSIIPGKLQEYIQYGYWDFVIDQKERTFKKRDNTNPLIYNTDITNGVDDTNYQIKKRQNEDDLKKFINQASIFLANPDKVSISSILLNEPDVSTDLSSNIVNQSPNVNTEIGLSPLIQSPNVKGEIDKESFLERTFDRALDYGIDYAEDYIKRKTNEKINEWKNKLFKISELDNIPINKITQIGTHIPNTVDNFENIIKNKVDTVTNINSVDIVNPVVINSITKVEKIESNINEKIIPIERISNQATQNINQLEEIIPVTTQTVTSVNEVPNPIVENITSIDNIPANPLENITPINNIPSNPVQNVTDVNLSKPIATETIKDVVEIPSNAIENISNLTLNINDVVDKINDSLQLPPDVIDKTAPINLKAPDNVKSITDVNLSVNKTFENLVKSKIKPITPIDTLNDITISKPSIDNTISDILLEKAITSNAITNETLNPNIPNETITNVELTLNKPSDILTDSNLQPSIPSTNVTSLELIAPVFSTKMIKIKLIPPSVVTKISGKK